MKDNIVTQKQLQEAKNADYAKEWKTSVNDKGETVHNNDILRMQIIRTKQPNKK